MTGMPFADVPLIHWLPDGKRLRMRHGPIELVVEADGDKAEVEFAYRQVVRRFRAVLDELVVELGWLREPLPLACLPSPLCGGKGRGWVEELVSRAQPLSSVPASTPHPQPFPHKGGKGAKRFVVTSESQIATHMHQTATHFDSHNPNHFITPMICVAGAVADHLLATMLKGRTLDKAYINNGGDIALYLAPGQSFDVGVCANPLNGSLASHARITAESGIGGIATSGWRGRSHSLGIADAVTVLAKDAATADTAATLIANVIDLPGHIAIQREKACELRPDSDLGERLVTTAVAELSMDEIEQALEPGQKLAQHMIDQGDVVAVYGSLQAGSFSVSQTMRHSIEEAIHA